MTNTEKQEMLAKLLNIASTDEDFPRLLTYLEFSEKALCNHYYRNVGLPEVIAVPEKYEMVQIEACIAGFNLQGAEMQDTHNENGISRSFHYESMIAYIESKVFPLVKVV